MRKAIALLITLMFVMIISIAVGYGLSQMKKATQIKEDEDILYKSSMILHDVLTILKSSQELNRYADDDASADFHTFLATTGYLPLHINDQKIVISLHSARSRLNINMLNKYNELLFRNYFNRYMVGGNYVDILKECMRKNQAKDEYNNYQSRIFDENPTLFRNYIASKKHLLEINKFYLKEYGDVNLKMVPFDELFSYGNDKNAEIDLNYATVAVWQLILDVTKERAETLFLGEGNYNSLKDLDLTPQEKINLKKFKTTFYAPTISVEIEFVYQKKISKIYFIYDIKLKRGYDFVFEV